MTTASILQPNSGRFQAFLLVDGWTSDQVFSGPFVTGQFTFDQAPWAIVWSAGDGDLSVTVNDLEAPEGVPAEEVLNTSQERQGISYVGRAGTFYLTVTGAGRWVVKVVDVN